MHHAGLRPAFGMPMPMPMPMPMAPLSFMPVGVPPPPGLWLVHCADIQRCRPSGQLCGILSANNIISIMTTLELQPGTHRRSRPPRTTRPSPTRCPWMKMRRARHRKHKLSARRSRRVLSSCLPRTARWTARSAASRQRTTSSILPARLAYVVVAFGCWYPLAMMDRIAYCGAVLSIGSGLIISSLTPSLKRRKVHRRTRPRVRVQWYGRY